MVSSEHLLRRYTEQCSDEAFGELVQRHVNLVYSAALRQVAGDAALAADIVQDVFADFARKARRIPEGTLVAGWLYRHTRFTAAKAVRSEFRRRAREKEAFEMSAHVDSEDNWVKVAPVVDEAISLLSDADRDAVLLRFFEGCDLRTVGAALGTTEDAAQKRISRALEKLRVLLTRRGVALSATSLASLLSANGIVGAPVGMAVAVTGSALTCAGTAAASLWVAKLLFMGNLKIASIGAVVIAGIATPLALQYRTISKLHAENGALRVALENAAQQTTGPTTNNAQLTDPDRVELMRLRGEAARWRTQQQELARLQEQNKRLQSRTPAQGGAQPPAEPTPPAMEDYLPRDRWADIGYATPQAALQTLGWAIGSGNVQRFKESVLITDAARQHLTDLLAGMHPNALAEAKQRGWGVEEGLMFPMMAQDRKEGYTGFRINSQESPSSDEVVVQVALETSAGRTHDDRFRFKRMGLEWKRLLDVEDLPDARKP
jgi:RNA polymerase sigma factor (sigma-70 family)